MKKRKKALEVGSGKSKIRVSDYISCSSYLSKVRGLMFRPKNFSRPLVFTWKKPARRTIHSFFVFQKFVAVWVLGNKIIEKRLVKPWKCAVTPKGKFDKLIEIPITPSE
jgi:uncharacterized membrane protein (UPF0127 family)